MVSTGGSIPPFGTKISILAESKVVRMGSKNLACGSIEVIVSRVTIISIPYSGPMDPGHGRNSTIYWKMIQSIYNILENFSPALQSIAA